MTISSTDYHGAVRMSLADTNIAKSYGRETLYAAIERKANEVKRPGDSFERAFVKALETEEGSALYSAYLAADKPKPTAEPTANTGEVAKSAKQVRLQKLAEEKQAQGLSSYEALKQAMEERPDLAE